MYAGEQPLTRGHDAVETFKAPATARLSLRENFPLREFSFLKSVAKAPAKAMLMGPDRVAQMCDIAKSAPHYTSADAFLADVVEIQHRMVGDLVAAGCAYVQLDEPSYTGYVDRTTLERIKSRGEDPMGNLARAIRASNAVIAGHGDKATFGIHICRGNRASMWHREGSYDGIAEELFRRWPSTACCSNTTRSGPAASSRCASCRRGGWWCSGSSPPRPERWRRSTPSGDASTGPSDTSASSNWPSVRSAALPRALPATS